MSRSLSTPGSYSLMSLYNCRHGLYQHTTLLPSPRVEVRLASVYGEHLPCKFIAQQHLDFNLQDPFL